MGQQKAPGQSLNHADHANCNHDDVSVTAHRHLGGGRMNQEPSRIFKIGIVLNAIFVICEIFAGSWINSLSLISDAVHNLTDVFALILAWLGYEFSKKRNSQKYSLMTSMTNSILLIGGCGFLIYESIMRLSSLVIPHPLVMMLVASIGFVINFVSAQLFHEGHHHDLNMKTAYLHLMGDAAISLGVVITGLVLYFKPIYWLDPAVSILVSSIIIFVTVKVLKQAIFLFRQI